VKASRRLLNCYYGLRVPEGVMSQRRPGTPNQGEDSQKETAYVAIHLGGLLTAQSVPQAFPQIFSVLRHHGDSVGSRETGLGCPNQRKSPVRCSE